ncbi:hypothetical protein [Absidia glauca]|uniref:R3H domain-containing protein n=1 Tax=Absidia glauca TaxID=4829 RepID=A0A163JV79_ABSGL|nr:hypothetical protein [Absidia glauca]
MTVATGTRIFFVESTAHWEAMQREKAQFHSTTSASPDHTTAMPTKKQQQPLSKPPPLQRDSLASRNALAVGKPGSRRRNRWDNNHLKDNPKAVLYQEDLKPPGHQHSSSSISFLQWQWDSDGEDDLALTENDFDNDSNGPHLTRQMRHGLKRHHIPEGWVMQYEKELLDYLSRRQHQDKPDEGLSQHHKTLTWEIDDSYLRWIVHAICRYYNVDSYSETTQDGRRVTIVNWTADHQLERPQVSFLDYIKK